MSADSQKKTRSKLPGRIEEDIKRLGKYEIVRRIGAGGMGTVFLANDTVLKRTVALKVLPKERAESPTLVRRFQSEAHASALLNHDNIVSVYEADQADGYLYIALEFVEGIDLYEWLKKRKTIPVKRSVDIIKQVALALEHAHIKRLVHRDIKPANIMVTPKGVVKLMDLGLARSIDETLDTTITRAGTTVGTVDYMSPEQAANSKNADIRSDIYSLGCTWYHMLTGQAPYPEGDLTNKLRAHATEPIPDPRELNDQVGEALVAVLHRMMAKKKKDRYQSPRELLDDLNSAVNLDKDSNFLLATLLAEDESESGILLRTASDESAVVVIQDEPQSELLQRQDPESSPSTTSDITSRKTPPPPDRKEKKRHKRPNKSANKRSRPVDAEPVSSEEIEATVNPQQQKINPRKTLKRVRNVEELNIDEFKTEPDSQVPPEVDGRSSTESKKVESGKKKPVPSKQRVRPAKKRSKVAKETPGGGRFDSVETTEDGANQKSGRSPLRLFSTVDIDWGRAGITIGLLVLVIGLLWWGISKFGADSPEGPVNPYGLETESLPNVPQQGSEQSQLELINQDSQDDGKNSPTNPIAEIIDEDTKSSRPRWVIQGWDRPQRKRDSQLQVRRGKRGRNTFFSLEQAIENVGTTDTTIDVAKLKRQPLRPMEIQLTKRLTIRGNGQQVFSFQCESIPKGETPRSWLSTQGGVLEIVGVNFIVGDTIGPNFEFIRLDRTDLILRNCTITAIGEKPLAMAGIHNASANNNRVVISDCLVRGNHLNAVSINNTACDIASTNSLFASKSGVLFDIPASKSPQALYVSNSTIFGGVCAFDLHHPASSNSLSGRSLTFRRSLFISGSQTTAAFRVSGNQKSNGASLPEKAESLTLDMQHVRFLNYPNLTEVIDGKDKKAFVKSTADWEQFWSQPLPSDDLIESNELAPKLNEPADVSAAALKMALGKTAQPGVGDRALLGVDAESVATIEPNELERLKTLSNLARNPAFDQKSPWTGKTVTFDLTTQQDLFAFLSGKECPDGTTVVCTGHGTRQVNPMRLENRILRLRFQQVEGKPLTIENGQSSQLPALFVVDGGRLHIEDGRFEVRKSRSAEQEVAFLNTMAGASIVLANTQVSNSLNDTRKTPLIALGENSERNGSTPLNIRNSMISGAGPLIQWETGNQSLELASSIFVSSNDSVVIIPGNEPSKMRIDRCTFSQKGAAFRCATSGGIVATYLTDSLFAPPIEPSKSATILTGTSQAQLQGSIEWWESGCGYAAQIPKPLETQDPPIIGRFLNTWSNFWSPIQVDAPLHGATAIVMKRSIQDHKNLETADFELSPSCEAANWRIDGTPIGAVIKTIGPQQKKEAKRPTAQPRQRNTPIGF